MSSKTAAVPPLVDVNKTEPGTLKRRAVFAGAGAVGALAATAAVLPLAQPVPEPAALAKTPDPDGGYQLTEHVARYYQTARV